MRGVDPGVHDRHVNTRASEACRVRVFGADLRDAPRDHLPSSQVTASADAGLRGAEPALRDVVASLVHLDADGAHPGGNDSGIDAVRDGESDDRYRPEAPTVRDAELSLDIRQKRLSERGFVRQRDNHAR